MLKFRFLTKLL